MSDIQGTDGNDNLVGTASEDSIDGGAGADKMAGGDGWDTYYVDNAGDLVIEAPNQGIDTVEVFLTSYTLPDNVEYLDFLGSGSFTGMGNSLDNYVIGGNWNDVLGGL